MRWRRPAFRAGCAPGASPHCWNGSGFPIWRSGRRVGCRAANSSGLRWRGRWRAIRKFCLLDEPTANLDPAATRSVEEIVLSAARSGIKIVMASHDLGQVRRLAGDVIFLVRGALCEQRPGARFSRSSGDAGSRRLPARRSRDLICSREDPMTFRFSSLASAVLVGVIVNSAPATAEDRSIVVASTTSTQDSGLFGYLLPIFKAKTGIEVKVIAQGTGQALDTARRGDADVVFVHAKAQEEKFLAEGFGVQRFDVMYNDFVLIGPKRDPAGVKGKDIETALKAIQAKSRAVRLARRQIGHALGRTCALEAGRHRYRRQQGPVVSRDRAGHGGRAQHRERDEWLCAVRPRHLDILQEPWRSRNSGRRRQAAVQSIRRHAGESCEISHREEGTWPDLRRLAGLAGRPGRDRGLQDRRPAAVLSRTRTRRGVEAGMAYLGLVSGGQAVPTSIDLPPL